MASNSDLALVGATGVAYTSAVGTTGPTDFSALSSWDDLGYISDDGLVAGVSDDRKEWTPWGSLQPIRSQITKSTKTFKIVCWETNETVLGLYYRQEAADVAPGAGNIISFEDNDRPTPDRRAFVFDIIDGNNDFRFHLPEAEVTERGGVTYKTDELIGYEMTITAYPDINGLSVRRFLRIAALS